MIDLITVGAGTTIGVCVAGATTQLLIRGWHKLKENKMNKILSIILVIATLGMIIFGGDNLIVAILTIITIPILLGLISKIRYNILDTISEAKILQETIIVLFLASPFLVPSILVTDLMNGTAMFDMYGGSFIKLLIYVAPIGVLLTLYAAFSKKKNGEKVEIGLYVWFMIINIIFALFYMSELFGAGFFSKGSNPINSFMLGTFLLIMVLNILQIGDLLGGKDEPAYVTREKRARYFKLFREKFLDINISRTAAIIIIVVQSGVFLVNYYFSIMPDSIILAFSLFAAGILHMFYSSKNGLALQNPTVETIN